MRKGGVIFVSQVMEEKKTLKRLQIQKYSLDHCTVFPNIERLPSIVILFSFHPLPILMFEYYSRFIEIFSFET